MNYISLLQGQNIYEPSAVKLKHLHSVNISVIYMESQCSPYDMETLNSGCTWINDKHVALGIPDHFEYM